MASWQGFEPKVIDVFGGLVTNVDRNDLGGVFVSPNCQDVEFTVGSVHSRRGTTTIASGTLPGNGTVNGLFSGWQPNLGPVVVGYTASASADQYGSIFIVNSAGTLQYSSTGYIGTAQMTGVAALARFWMTFPTVANGGSYGVSTTVPRVYDYNAATPLYSVGLPQPSAVGMTATQVASTGNTTTAGTHLVRVTFESQDGSTSPISLYCSVTTTGAADTGIQVANIPTGPPGTIRRVLWATTAADYTANGIASQNYFTLRSSTMVVNDNTTTTQVIAFTDAALTAGETASSGALFTLMRVPPAKGMVFYKNRAFWYHLMGAVQPAFVGPTFENYEWDADLSAYSAQHVRGWAATGAQAATVAGDNGPRILRFTTDGGVSCVLTSNQMNTAAIPSVIAMFQQGKQYGVCFRARRGASSITQGTLELRSAISGYSFTYSLPLTALTTDWQTFYTGPLQSGFDFTTLAKYASFTIGYYGTPTNARTIDVEPLVWYDATGAGNGGKGNAWQGSLVLASKPFYPGTCDGATGLISVNRDDGEHINSAFVFRDNLYFVKNHSMYVTADNGVTEPGGWTVQNVSKVCGTLAANGVAVGDAFVIICGSDGVYYFDGGEPKKISQEIAPTWARIPQSYAYLTAVTINQADKQVIISVALDSETRASHQIVLDYTEGFGDPLEANGHGRKWTIWNHTPAASFAYYADWGFSNVPYLMFGDGTFSLYKQASAATKDAGGNNISALYETSPIGYGGAGVSLIGGVILNANGTSLDLSYTNPFGTNTAIGTYPLTNPMTRVTQALLNLSYETVGIRVAGTSPWSINKMTVFARSHPYFNIRGYNP